MDDSIKSNRIAKNTAVLYIRMLFLMIITLYTSRVILRALGVDDFGIYNVVGGFVSMFAIVCKALSGACSRFLNYEMGTGKKDRLQAVFSTAVNIHVALALLIAFLAETIGLWFLNFKMTIPVDRLTAANWCYQLSLVVFCSNLITVPYNAAIIAHERMKAFAFVSLFDGFSKLGIAIAILYTSYDKLILYALLLCVLQLCVQLMYRLYCLRNFAECKYRLVYENGMLKQILSYSGWNFLGHASGILRNQGGNVLINLFFGPAVNAARGISNQVLHAVDGFVSNFVTAMAPQISQSYARGDLSYMRSLVYTGAKFSYFLLFLLSLPILLNTEYILSLWLTEVPDYSTIFVRLMIVYSLIDSLNRTIQHAQAATGKIRDYQLVVATCQLMILPVSYVFFKMGRSAEYLLYVSIFFVLISVFLRLYMLSRIIKWDLLDYTKKVLLKVFFVTIVSLPIPLAVHLSMNEGILHLLLVSVLCVTVSIVSIYIIGLEVAERNIFNNKIKLILKKASK